MITDIEFNEDYILIKDSELFDVDWFINQYSLDSSIDPIFYYLEYGVEEGLNPSEDFDTLWYLEEYPSVKGVFNPLVHYIRWGKDAGWFSKPNPFYLKHKVDYFIILRSGLFDEEWFLSQYSFVGDVNPILYYLEYGVEEGLNPSEDFDTLWYLEEYSEISSKNLNPLVHYIRWGKDAGYLPKSDPLYLKHKVDYFIILRSGLFDVGWFLSQYSFVGDVNPILYYLEYGVEEGLNPSEDFDTLWYLEEYPSVKGVFNPLIHYIRWGKDSGWFSKFDPLYEKYKYEYFTILRSGLFDEEWFLKQYSLDIDIHPIFYYLEYGVEEGLNPSEDFDTLWYLDEYRDVAVGGYNPLLHYINLGSKIGWYPKPNPLYVKYRYEYFTILRSGLFDEEWFLKQYSLDIDIHPIFYYLEYGVEEGLNPSEDFDTLWYLDEYPDVAVGGYNPLFHYIKFGRFDGNLPRKFSFDSKYNVDYGIILGSGLFDKDWFMNKYSIDVSIDPIIYYIDYCVEKKLDPSSEFDTLWYLREYEDVRNQKLNPFAHYIKYGKQNGYLPKMYEISEIDNLPLKKSFRGKNHYFFLVNDSNNELKQHFDKNYMSNFSPEVFYRDYNFKRNMFTQKGVDYYYFFVPDKSVVCNNLLPVIHDKPIRNIDKLEYIPDFSKNLNNSDFWPIDSHLNLNGAKKLSFSILNYIDNSFRIEDYNNLLNGCDVVDELDPSDLLRERNSSYSLLDRQKIHRSSLKDYIPKNLAFKSIPQQFAKCGNRDSEYIVNQNSFSDLKVLIFRDSSLSNMKNFLSLYFREMFLYWDHLNLSRELIEYYNPDMIIEIRIERFMEGYKTSDWIEELINKNIIY